MGLFKGFKLDHHGIRTEGVVERVTPARLTSQQGHSEPVEGRVFRDVQGGWTINALVRFTDQQGVEQLGEKSRPESVDSMLVPGAVVEVRYLPDDPATWDWYSTYHPNPDVPRGWGAGIFEVPESKPHGAFAIANAVGVVDGVDGSHIDAQREIFRRGPVQDAEIVRVYCANPALAITAARQYSLTLRVAEGELTTEAWLPGLAVPDVGARIKVVVETGTVALDTDERYDGPPGQAIVWTPSPDVLSQRREQPALGAQIAEQTAFVAGQQDKLAQFEAKRAAYEAGQVSAPSGASTTPGAVEDLQEAMARFKRGEITIDEFREIQLRINS